MRISDWSSDVCSSDLRFKRSENQVQTLTPDFDWQYLALYDVFDAQRFSQEHWDNALTSRMMVTDAIDDNELEDYHYYRLQFRDNDPENRHDGGVILEQLIRTEERRAGKACVGRCMIKWT